MHDIPKLSQPIAALIKGWLTWASLTLQWSQRKKIRLWGPWLPCEPRKPMKRSWSWIKMIYPTNSHKDVVLLTSSSYDLLRAQESFAAEYDTAGIKLFQIQGHGSQSLLVRDESLPQGEEPCSPTLEHIESSFDSPYRLSVSSSQMKRQLERLNWNRAVDPDSVSPRVPKICIEQVCGITHCVFHLNLSQEKVPVLWKTSGWTRCPLHESPSMLLAHLSGPTTVCLSSWGWCWGCLHVPASVILLWSIKHAAQWGSCSLTSPVLLTACTVK